MPPTRPPRPWLAALLSLLMPGAGLFYAGRRRAGLQVAGAVLALLAVVLAARLVPVTVLSVAALLVCSVLGVAVTVAAVIASYLEARRARRDGRLRSSWRPVLALAAAGIAAGSIVVDLPGWLGRPHYSLQVASDSMLPGQPVGLRLFAAGSAMPGRGSLVVFRPTPGLDVRYIKRVVALGGDRVALRAGRLYVNGVAAAPTDPEREVLDGHSYDIIPMPPQGSTFGSEMPEQTVPDGTMFVLGDNRQNSMDSRFPQFGTIPLDRLDAVGGVAYWMPGEGLILRPLR